MAAAIAREIRTPLTAILGYTDLLLGKPAGDADHLVGHRPQGGTARGLDQADLPR
jgi:signal transduction histidine kinase